MSFTNDISRCFLSKLAFSLFWNNLCWYFIIVEEVEIDLTFQLRVVMFILAVCLIERSILPQLILLLL